MRPAGATALVALATGALLSGCAGDSTAVTEPPLCDSGNGDSGNGVVLMARSVPTATQVPCISAALPLGWDFHHLLAGDGAARFWLDSDRDGQEQSRSASPGRATRTGRRRSRATGRTCAGWSGSAGPARPTPGPGTTCSTAGA